MEKGMGEADQGQREEFATVDNLPENYALAEISSNLDEVENATVPTSSLTQAQFNGWNTYLLSHGLAAFHKRLHQFQQFPIRSDFGDISHAQRRAYHNIQLLHWLLHILYHQPLVRVILGFILLHRHPAHRPGHEIQVAAIPSSMTLHILPCVAPCTSASLKWLRCRYHQTMDICRP